ALDILIRILHRSAAIEADDARRGTERDNDLAPGVYPCCCTISYSSGRLRWRSTMESQGRDALEDEIRRHYTAGAVEAADAAALRGYGREILSFLVAVHGEADASEVFSIFCEAMWCALPRFAWQCSFRTWAYTLCRYRSQTYRRGARRRAAREVLLSDSADL